jgi:hypothetical protein
MPSTFRPPSSGNGGGSTPKTRPTPAFLSHFPPSYVHHPILLVLDAPPAHNRLGPSRISDAVHMLGIPDEPNSEHDPGSLCYLIFAYTLALSRSYPRRWSAVCARYQAVLVRGQPPHQSGVTSLSRPEAAGLQDGDTPFVMGRNQTCPTLAIVLFSHSH